MDWGANFRTAIELILYLIAAVKNNKTTVPAKETATVYYVTDGDTVRVKILLYVLSAWILRKSKIRVRPCSVLAKKLGLWSDSACSGVASPITTKTSVLVAQTISVPSTPAISCIIKGNISTKEKIYHLPGCASYKRTIINENVGEKWFCSEEEAVKAGFRKAKNCGQN